MSSYELIKDMEKKLGLYRDNHLRSVSTPNRIHEMVASYLCGAEIYPSLLSKQVVKALIEERYSWPVSGGGEYCLANPVLVEELEKARIISFPNDCLCVQRTHEVTPDMPEKLRNQLNAHEFLYDIRYDVSDLVTPHLRVPKDHIKPCELLLIDECIKVEGDFIKLSIEHDDIVGIGTFLWKRLRALRPTPDEAFAEYASKMRLASGRLYVFDIDFDHEIDAEEYLQCAYNYLIKDETLYESWEECAADVALSHNGVSSLTEALPRPALSTNSSDNKIYTDALDISLLDTVTNSITSKSNQTLLEGAEWWHTSTQYRYCSHERMSGYLVWLIISHEHNSYSPENSFPITRKLISLARSAPRLLGSLFSDISRPQFLCFLLSNLETNHIGLISLYKILQSRSRPISEKVAYEQIWQNLLWTQGLEIYSYSFQKYLEVIEIQGVLERACEMVAWFTAHELGYSSRGKSISDTRLPSLKDSFKSINYITPSGLIQSVVHDHLEGMCDIIDVRLRSRRADGAIPLGEWLMMFWCIDWSSKSTNQTRGQEIKKICELMINNYLSVLQERVSKHCNASDDPLVFDELEWVDLYRIASKPQRAKWIYPFEEKKTSTLPKDYGQRRSFVFAIRMHMRLLLRLHASELKEMEKDELAEELLSIIDLFGFDSDGFSGALDYMSDNSDYSQIRLWPDICDSTNRFNASQFEKLIKIMQARSAPLSSLFTLLERTVSLHYRRKVIEAISARDLGDESPNWMPEVFDIVLSAANSDQMEIAKHFLNYAKTHGHKTHKNKIDELSSKIELKAIFDDTACAGDNKLENLRQFKVTSEDRQVKNEVKRFRDYLIATLTVDVNAERSLSMFKNMLNTEPTLQNATGLVQSALALAESSKLLEPLEDYFQIWLKTYNSIYASEKRPKISNSDLNFILQLCLRLSRLDDFSSFWGIATTQQREAYELASLRVEYLKRIGRKIEAVAYIQHIKKLHQELPQAIIEELDYLKANLEDPGVALHTQLTLSPTVDIFSGLDKLRDAWLRIKDLDAYDQSQIFMRPTKLIDDFLFEIVDQIGNELLFRVGNLQRKKPLSQASSVISLDDEDMINDWFVSLAKQRMNFVGWKIFDQSRRGRSASGKGVGENDGWIEDSKGNSVTMIEAFRLGNSLSHSTISEHLNKLSKYNSNGTSPLFVVIYSAARDFPDLCSKYAEYIQKTEYEGFDNGKPIKLEKKVSKLSKASVIYYEETRFINDSPIKIYHQLLDLRPTQDPN